MIKRAFGEVVPGLVVDGKELHSRVFNENQVRAAAGLTMAAGAVAFAYAYFARSTCRCGSSRRSSSSSS